MPIGFLWVVVMSYSVFDVYAERYDSWYARNRFAAESEVLVLRELLVRRPALEVGVGTGFFSSRLGVEFGVDPSARMLAKAVCRGVECTRGVGEHLPFRSSCFRTVLFIVTVCFMEDPLRGFTEAHRVLLDNGVLIACIVPSSSPWGKLYRQKAAAGHPIYRAARFYKVSKVATMASKAGFTIKRVIATLKTPPPANHVEEPKVVSVNEAEEYGFSCIEAHKNPTTTKQQTTKQLLSQLQK